MAKANKVYLSVPFRVEGVDYAQFKMLSKEYQEAGNYAIRRISERAREFHIIQAEKGKCANCGKEKKLVRQRVDTGEKWCRACSSDYIYGSEGRRVIMAEMQAKFQMPYRNYLHLAWRNAKLMYTTWEKNNWGKILRESEILAALQKCKERMTVEDLGADDAPEIIKRIRRMWYYMRAPRPPSVVFEIFLRDKRISKKNRRKRKKQLKAIGNLRKCQELVLEPVCKGCGYLVEAKDRWLCRLWLPKHKGGERRKPDRVPTFYSSKVDLQKEWYHFFEQGDKLIISGSKRGEVGLALWNKDKGKALTVEGLAWILEHYDIDLKNNKYPELYFDERNGQFYFMYPYEVEVEIKEGDWKHVVVFGLSKAVVVSEIGGKRHVKFFNYSRVPAVKRKYSKLRQRGNVRFRRKIGDRESRIRKYIFHNVTRDIQRYLEGKWGEVIIVNPKKRLYFVREENHRELNQRLSWWSTYTPRQFLKYKLELRGFKVVEKDFPLYSIAVCPHCKRELMGTWQDMYVRGMKNYSCDNCGASNSILYAIASWMFINGEHN